MKIPADRALKFCESVLVGLGTSSKHAGTIARHLIEADVKGVRSHGLIRLLRYVDQIDSGYIDNRATPVLTQTAASVIQIDAKKNWGILALDALLPALVSMARETGIAGGAVVNCAHTGRIGAFSEALARQHMWGMVFGGGGNRRLQEVAPFGGAKAVFDTNPYAFSAPISREEVSTADFATSATAQGKVLVYKTNKRPLPDGWIIDKHGNASNEAEDFYNGGALLPSGAHKGYGMGFIAELFAESALGVPHELNWFAVAVDLQQFTPKDSYFERANALKGKIETCPPAAGVDAVMWPGQPELKSEQHAREAGIEYSDLELLSFAGLEERFGQRL